MNVAVVCATVNGGEWTWISGSNVTSRFGVYGTQGLAAAGPSNYLNDLWCYTP